MADFEQINQERSLAVYRAALSVATEWELEAVLQQIADQSRAMVNARYAALGVTHDDLSIRLFVTSGIDLDTRTLIGPLPHGRGLLGAIIHDRISLRIEDMSTDPRSVGFPPDHPPMKSLLGVPVALRERVLGNLYLCDREDGEPFTEEDQRIVEALAVHAAAAIDRAKVMEQLGTARAEADRQREYVQELLEQLPVGVYVPEKADGHTQLINAEARRLLGLDETSQDQDVRPHLFTEDGSVLAPGVDPSHSDLMRGRTLWAGSGENVRPVLVSSIDMPSPDSTSPQTVVVMQDMSRALEAERLKSDFLSLVSHELNTPITTIIGAAHLLQSGASSLTEIDRQELLGDLVAESDRLAKMLTNLITVTSVYAGRVEPETEPALLEFIVQRAVASARRRSRERLFFVDIPKGMPPVEADPNLLEHVLANVFDNSIKYGSPEGKIRIRADVRKDSIVLYVDDDGRGIDPDQLSRVFERFYRSEHSTTTTGLGLGLYLCRFLVEAQGGKIWAESAGKDQGTTIAIELPIALGWADDNLDGQAP